jgi:hypothetical protein
VLLTIIFLNFAIPGQAVEQLERDYGKVGAITAEPCADSYEIDLEDI